MIIFSKKNQWRKYYKRFSFSKKRYYIIRRSAYSTGLFSLVNTHLGHIDYAIKKGFIPVIDMMNYPNCYLDEEDIGRINSWEYYFEQPLGVGLDEANMGSCILVSEGEPISPRPDDNLDFFNNSNGELDYWRSFAHKYLIVKKTLMEEIDAEYSSLVSNKDRVIGVLVRGTDYLSLKPFCHPVQPSPNMVIEKCKELMAKYRCNKIFLATEDRNVYTMFLDSFGERLIVNSREYIDYIEGKSVPDIPIERQNDRYLRGKEYVSSIVMLSRCNVFVGGRTSGTVGAFMLSEGFEHSFIFDLGRYGTDSNW